ncbi:MAG: hypothetical protein ACO3IN_05395 [Steroidobacteraceae bacterium]|jgi:hypothetical protein
MYAKEIRNEILDRIGSGESLRSICRDDGMPDKSVVFRWLASDEEFATKYARARLQQAEVIFDGLADIEDQVLNEQLKPDAAKVVLWSRHWRASKLNPKKYGDKIETTHELGDSVSRVVREIVRA